MKFNIHYLDVQAETWWYRAPSEASRCWISVQKDRCIRESWVLGRIHCYKGMLILWAVSMQNCTACVGSQC